LVQLSLNAAWPVLFFRVRDKRSSLVVIALLDCALVAEIASLRNEDAAAASLLLPYLVWSTFATALNASVSDPGTAMASRSAVGLSSL
jgi:tryptophan-rich sensory protein